MCIINAYSLYNEQQQVKIRQLKFREELIHQKKTTLILFYFQSKGDHIQYENKTTLTTAHQQSYTADEIGAVLSHSLCLAELMHQLVERYGQERNSRGRPSSIPHHNQQQLHWPKHTDEIGDCVYCSIRPNQRGDKRVNKLMKQSSAFFFFFHCFFFMAQ